jgi:deoxyribonuclease-4
MYIKLGPAGSPAGSTLEGVHKVRELGLQAMEVEFVRGVKMGNETAKQCGAAARENGISLSIHAPYYINLASEEKEKRDASKKRILDSCERGHHLGATNIVFHAAYYGKLSKEHVYEIVKQAVEDMQNVLDSRHWEVRLAPETTGKGSQFGTVEELVKLAKETKCGFCLDPAHVYARDRGQIDYAKVLGYIQDGLRPQALHCHFSGITYTLAGERNHEVLASGKPPFEPFARELLKRKISATIISESPITWKDSLHMKEVFEKLGYRF